LVVITTASRAETRDWVRQMGADQVVNHRDALAPQLAAQGFAEVDFIANFNNTDAYWKPMAELIRAEGKIAAIVENTAPLELGLLKSKSATFVWEFMFTRAMFKTKDMARQGEILDEAAALFDAGKLRTTLTKTLSPINAANLREAHGLLESGQMIGKLAVAGWR
jgi:NADPH:quinone reductase-like Zn-dependent oxidoreductase